MELAHKNFNLWNAALQSKKSDAVAALYAEDNTFIPTMSGTFRKGQEEAEGYFEHFLQKNPEGQIVEDECQAGGPDLYVHSGHYNFVVGPEDKRETVEARFTYVWRRESDGSWKIMHHHSSVKPQN